MEAVAAAASIAGIVTLTAQCLGAVLKLRNFYHDVTWASKDIDIFIRDVDSLQIVLNGVKDICSSVEAIHPTQRPTFNLASLQIQVEDCSKDMVRWLKAAQDLHPYSFPEGPPKGTLSTFKKFRAAIDKRCITNMREQLVSYERGINSCLTVLGRELDLRQASTLHSIQKQINATLDVHSILNSKIDTNTEIMRDIASSAGSVAAISPAVSLRLESIEATAKKTAETVDAMASQFLSRTPPTFPSLPGSSPFYASGPSPYQTYDMQSGRSGMPIDTVTASIMADEKRKRNAGASARFRQRRREKEREASIAIFKLEEENRALVESRDFYRSERAYFRDWVSRGPFPLPDRPSSPVQSKNWHGLPHWKQDSLHIDLDFVIDEMTGYLPPPVKEYVTHCSMWNLVRSHKQISCVWLDSIQSGHDPAISSFFSPKSWASRQEGILRKLLRARKTCMTEGHDILVYDHALNVDQTVLDNLAAAAFDDEAAEPENWQGVRTFRGSRPSDWTTTRDRVNNWLLQSLQASETLAHAHKHILNLPDLDEEEWARLVLKHWHVDEAAVGGRSEVCSTDGAVGSMGGRHSVRVTFVNERKRRASSSLGANALDHVGRRPNPCSVNFLLNCI